MKKLTLLLLALFSLIEVNAKTFEIKVLNTPTINIGGKVLHQGCTFDEKDFINWSSDRQAMKVLSDDNKIYVLSKGLLTKHKAKTFADYVTSVKSATVRNDGENFPVTLADHRAIFESDFILLDYVSINVGWRTDNSSYFEASTSNLGNENFSFIIPSYNDGILMLNRSLFTKLPNDCNSVILSVRYIEKDCDETTLITDSMNLEIVPLNIAEKESL